MGFQPRYYTLPNGSTVYFSDTIPSAEGSGVIANVGDMCIVSSATASGAELAWMCIKAGSPGTWVVCASGVQEYIFYCLPPLRLASHGSSRRYVAGSSGYSYSYRWWWSFGYG